ncbi:acyl-CoA dehydrogenase family protein [Bordetella holmesii]|uniref:Acyl-CoA dehydrogenase, C-terminal domain protein n=2 Tax=Bordetella holmesii TaxID=35814 RepID=A0A158LY27_9BORD|nr:acyl-CoA dehydrogenase family protein [Bordetella holmesii]AHV93916.1 acyl-CoA dehydrogenase, C-terminal domain protein [Bordetella holmesii ATCC 51541]EWM48774.1 acyl-CoA dehydrogenase, C-terminal domain protein [Bordetella holmesii 41130]EWM49968.1 acyl-CoA dehydrogenase, C-terminal domain protein [Bordetella holmesii 35009]AMD44487.1 DNA alkylation response protein [Bordetella holmesii H558]AMD50008.1 isovaleryl-CoA dehydrogenase [Bordetella holmesii F627]
MPEQTAVPDSRGQNLFDVDPYAAPMAACYLPEDLYTHLLPHLRRLGELAGGQMDELAMTADHQAPTLSVRHRSGADESRVEKHPAYVELERLAYSEFGLAALSHRSGVLGWPKPMPAAAKYALSHLFVQAEFGLCCPVSMTDSLARTLRRYGDPALVEQVVPQVTSLDFDTLRQGAMFMTEQGAGSDVSATTTQALLDDDGTWRLSGDKWFCSNPDAGFAMVLARSEADPGLKGVSLFLLPRDLPDGRHNSYRILRLKDKLGTRSMASGEIRLEGARAWLVGERGRGFKQMADMINNSRLSNGMRAAGLMRRAVSEAMFVARERQAFGRSLVDMPLMRRQLAKMMLWTEQARSVMYQTAQALAQAEAGQASPALARIMTPLIKFRACRDARKVTGDAMEVRGGCGYIEEWVEPRLMRDAHLGSIWEGTSNIVALDVLRAIRREEALPALRAHVDALLQAGRPCDPALADSQSQAVDGAFALAAHAAQEQRDDLARQAASALYHALSVAALRWEARLPALAGRGLLADQVLRHRLLPRNPCQAQENEDALNQRVLQAQA